MQSTKQTIGIMTAIIFCIGAGYIVLRFGGNKTDTSSSTDQPIADVPITNTLASNPTTSTTPTSTTTQVPTTNTTTPTPKPVATTPTSPYKDGTYSATGSYGSPAGTESIGVSVTLKDGIITASTVTEEANDGTSRRYQNMFISGYKTYVTGKSIVNLNLGRVSGSSLTPKGFNQALAKIKSEASA